MKTISKVLTVVLVTPSLVLAYMGLFGMQIGSVQMGSAVVLLAIWFLYITNPITKPLE
jgi:hypothetical protein